LLQKTASLQRKSTCVNLEKRDRTFDSIQEDEPEDLDDLLNKGTEGPDELEDDLEGSINTGVGEYPSNTGNKLPSVKYCKKRQHDDGKSTSNRSASQNASLPSTSSSKGTGKRLKQLTTQNDAQLSEVNRALDKLNHISGNVAKPDQFESYGRHVAAQLREIPIYNALVLMGKLDDIIRQERIQLLIQNEQNLVQNQVENEHIENKGKPRKDPKATEKPSSSNTKKNTGETRLENKQYIFIDQNGVEIPVIITNGSENDLNSKAFLNA
jgi:hypothetical protein